MCPRHVRSGTGTTVFGCMTGLSLLLLTAAHIMLLMIWVDSESSKGVAFEEGRRRVEDMTVYCRKSKAFTES